MDRTSPNRCAVCGNNSLPSVADFDGQSIPKIPRIHTCSVCGTRYKLRKNALAMAQARNRFWSEWVAPNMLAVIFTLGLALLILFPLFLLSKAIGRMINTPIFKQIR